MKLLLNYKPYIGIITIFSFLISSNYIFASEIKFNRIKDLDLILTDTIWDLAKDKDGYLWIGSNAGLLIYDGYRLRNFNKNSSSTIKNVRKIFSDKTGVLWVGTKGDGLFRIHENNITPFISSNSNESPKYIADIIQDDNGIWVGSDSQLVFISEDDGVVNYFLPKLEESDKKNNITSISRISDQEILITTYFNVYIFNTKTFSFESQEVEGLNNIFINTAYTDVDNNLWLGTDAGVFVKKASRSNFEPFKKESIDFRIDRFYIDNTDIWLGSGLNGLYKISKNDGSINQYKNNSDDELSISGDSITSMIVDDSGVMFLALFHGGLNFFDTGSVKFGLQDKTISSLDCAGTSVIHGIDVDEESIWLSSFLGLFEFKIKDKKCISHNLDNNNVNVFSPFHPMYSFKDSTGIRWVTSNKGLYYIDKDTGFINSTFQKHLQTIVYHMIEVRTSEFLLGTKDGLYRYSEKGIENIKPVHEELSKADIYKIYKGDSDYYLLATDKGLALLDTNGEYKKYSKINQQMPATSVYSIHLDKDQNIWLGTYKKGLFKFNKNGELLIRYNGNNGISPDTTIFSIISSDNYLWMGTSKGLIQLNKETDFAHNHHKSDGLQGEYFIIGSAAKSPSGKLYFGGRNGFNAFYPKDIKLNKTPPHIALTNLTRFGKPVQAGVEKDGFVINKPINDLNELLLTYKDYVIGFEFAALDFADPSRNKYAFKMEGQDPDWNYVNADDRKISYSNLAPGDYTFRVKAANKDGVWNEEGKSLKVKVLPAPWLTWWAYTLYVMTFFALLYAYMYRKNKANIEITKRLRIEVDKQTKELQIQKGKVEELLQRKNELFANVSHEFRTPLTLILGPINKLLASSTQSKEDVQSLQMVNRNANRLLTMIEQLLQLAKMRGHEDVNFVPQQVHANLDTLVASFQPLADTKDISLSLIQNDEAAISATQDVIDIVFGNLISNAIKYTQIGGEVIVKSVKQNNYITIEVSDNGCGLDENQQVEIFNRFTRLNTHLDIAGVGIGLSVVEEMLKVNNGTITVNSELGKGSTFAVKFHCVELSSDTRTVGSNQTLVDQLINESNTEEDKEEAIQYYGSKSNETILIIDDNKDMRAHVADTLKSHYYCITADRGKAGIAEAITVVPDIVICDVMMPEMDGFQVSRILRSDTRTSHIPLILLTALNDKKSRIKGWRENIDVYLTKPFDAQELLIQLENILVIRNILKKKAGAAIKSGKMSMNSGLPKNDQKFVDKFFVMIEKMYSDPNFLRPQMASQMAVSDRQLQRKLKALIDKNPLDYLREYRIIQAAKFLKDGDQVSITSDKCGFNSVTYFSKCFKKQYGVSPKVYQQTCNES